MLYKYSCDVFITKELDILKSMDEWEVKWARWVKCYKLLKLISDFFLACKKTKSVLSEAETEASADYNYYKKWL